MAEKLAGLKKKGGGGSKNIYVNFGAISNANVVCGFKPDYIVIIDPAWSMYNYNLELWYDSSVSTTSYQQVLNGVYNTYTINSNALITSINNDGFTLKASEIGNASADALIVAIKKED